LLYKYILENNIKYWDNLNFEEIDNLFQKSNKKLGFIKARDTYYYSIVQSGIENYQIIKAIHYFIKGSEFLNYEIKPENSKVYRISFSSKKYLNFIIKFFDNKLLRFKK